jgi:hypothetical protein
MLETPDYPTVARVMRVLPDVHEKPADGFSWADYEDVKTGNDADGEGEGEGDDGGWGVVKTKRASLDPSVRSYSNRLQALAGPRPPRRPKPPPRRRRPPRPRRRSSGRTPRGMRRRRLRGRTPRRSGSRSRGTSVTSSARASPSSPPARALAAGAAQAEA